MTIKPQNRTTPKPSNVSSIATDVMKDNTTTTDAMVFSEQTTANTPMKITTDTLNTTNYDFITTTKSMFEANVTEISVTNGKGNITSTTETQTNANCKKGFTLNHKGECEFKLQGTGNAYVIS